MKDLEAAEYEELKAAAITEIKKNLGMLTEIQQKYAKLVLNDIENGTLTVEQDKRFLDYIHEYMEKVRKSNIALYSEKLGMDSDLLYTLYTEYNSGDVDTLKLETLKKTVNKDLLKAYYGCSELKARIQLHTDLRKFIEERQADYDEKGC